MSKLIPVVAALLVSLTAGAVDLKTNSSLTVAKNVTSDTATAKCEISASGLDRQGTYSGVMLFRFEKYGQGTSQIFYVVFQVDPQNPTWTESSPGIYSVTATLKRGSVLVRADVPLNIEPMDAVLCDSRIDPGIQPPASGTTIYGANMRYDDRTPTP